MKKIRTLLCYLLLASGCLLAIPARAESDRYQQLIDQQLERVRQGGCEHPDNTLAQVLCSKELHVGVRTNYKGFGELVDDRYKGFEIELAQRIAKTLGVEVVYVPVSATDRIQKLLANKVDLVLATMAHTSVRDSVIHFVRPHYYSSPTAVVAPKSMKLNSLDDLSRVPVCVPLGNYSNIVFSEHRARLMIYDRPDRILAALRLGACQIVAHDRSLLVTNVTGPEAPVDLSSRFEEKLSTTEVPWGIGMRQADADTLGKVIAEILADYYQKGILLALAQKFHVENAFLVEQQKVWSRPDCLSQEGVLNKSCMLDPVSLADEPTKISPAIYQFQQWLKDTTAQPLSFPMLTGKIALNMFIQGMVNSIILVVLAMLCTMLVGLLVCSLLQSRLMAARLAGHCLRGFSQNSPIVLLMVLGFLIVSSFTSYSPIMALLTAALVIGLNNGCHAGSAMSDVARNLPQGTAMFTIVKNTVVQIRASLINAAKSSPVAAIIGAPELLSVLTDVTSFSGERVTTYLILSLFYLSVIQLVVWLCDYFSARWTRDDL